MSPLPGQFLPQKADDEKTIEFIKNYLPQELKGKFSDDELYYFLDLIDEYYSESGILDAQPDEDGYVNIDLEEVVAYIVKEAKKDEIMKKQYDGYHFSKSCVDVYNPFSLINAFAQKAAMALTKMNWKELWTWEHAESKILTLT